MPIPDLTALSRFLNRLLLRSDLAAREQEAILALGGRMRQAAPRHEIVAPGQTVDHACLMAEGLAARFDQMSDGSRQITAFHLPGDMCDLHSVACPTAGWGIVAIAPTSFLHVPHAELLAIAVEHPALAMAFWRDTVADGSVLAKWASNIGRKNAAAGMAHLLCELGVRMEQAALGTRERFHLEATQEQLGDALGISPVHTNRTLQLLRTAGLVAFAQRTVEIRDWDRLAAAGDFDPAYLLLGRPDARRDA